MLTQSKVYIIKLSFSLRRVDDNSRALIKSIIKIRSDLIERFYILEESFYSCLFYCCDAGVSTF